MKSGYTVPDNNFAGFGIFKGDRLAFENEPPQMGDFTLLEYNGEYQLVRLIGRDMLDSYIVCDKCFAYPHARALFKKIPLIGRLRV